DDVLGGLGELDAQRPLFLWVHLYDAHYPYSPPEPYTEQFPERPYDGEIAYMDAQLARLDEALAKADRDPYWMVVGDHGESHGEHRELTHGLFTYDATQRVPFIVSGPRQASPIQPQTVEEPVSIVDVTPTALSILGQPVPVDIDGQILPGQPRPLYMESYQLTERYGYTPHVTVIDGWNKLVHKGKPELYDLRNDPQERENLAADQPGEVERLEGILEQMEIAPPSSRTAPLDPEAIARLEALGYIGGGDFEVEFEELADPSDHLDTIGRMQRSDMLARQEQYAQAATLVRGVLEDEPGLVDAHLRLARLLVRSQEMAEANQVVQGAVEKFPENTKVLLSAATLFGRQGQDARGLDLARRVLDIKPEDQTAAEFVAGALGNLKRFEELDEFAATYLEDFPEAHAIAALSGTARFDRGDLAGAEPLLRTAVQSSRPRKGACRRLAILAHAAGSNEDAEALLRRELDLYPNQIEATRLLSRILSTLDRDEENLPLLEQLLEADPTSPQLHTALAAALFDLGRVAESRAAVEKGLKHSSDDPELVMMLANILAREGDMETATATRDRALSLKAAADAASKPKP
ncbi:MAG: sulfatase-like hydrolase/transferase, partial [Myxococcota bacterium]|nr:sulfatase-like hydrolase/transferase [Myxococcota bacterium]